MSATIEEVIDIRPERPDPTASEALVTIQSATKAFGHGQATVTALDGIDLTVRRGEFVSVLGASGCGKSTLLHLLAGLDQPTSGSIDIKGRAALMFQESALFPWQTISKNIETALRLRGVPRKDRRDRAHELLASVRLSGFEDRRPHELSGGMRQRAALARALAHECDVLLMDEPFGALDAITRELLHAELERHWAEQNLTVIFVTHDVREAIHLGDRIVMLSSRPGRVVADIPVDLPRPRRIEEAAVGELATGVTERLHREVRRHATH
ncbi:MAG: ABC transporter ATP-binding protein [Acidimicrobiia bacterium]